MNIDTLPKEKKVLHVDMHVQADPMLRTVCSACTLPGNMKADNRENLRISLMEGKLCTGLEEAL